MNKEKNKLGEQDFNLAIQKEREDGYNDILQYTTPIGDERTRLTNFLHGVQPVARTKMPGLNRDYHAHVFFTRPAIRLSYHNLTRSRKLAKLLNTRTNSLERYVRCLLDPHLYFGESVMATSSDTISAELRGLKSDLLNQYNPHMPPLSNGLLDLTGFPDPVLDVFSSKEGMRKEQYTWGDGINTINNIVQLDVTFANVEEEVIPLIMDTWLEYISRVRTGDAWPYLELMLGREIDYTTNITTIITGEDNRSIKHIASTIGFPIANPQGALFNVTASTPKSQENTTYNTRFQCFGMEYDDPILAMEFNLRVAKFHPQLRPYLESKKIDMVELSPAEYQSFGGLAIPFIDLKYNKLEWLISKDDYEIIKRHKDEK